MRNIKEIRAERDLVRAAYDAKIKELDNEIAAVRKARGYVPAAEKKRLC